MAGSPDIAPAKPPFRRFWFVDLAPGVTHFNMWVFLYASYATIGLLTFIAVGTPYVLSAHLGIPLAEQGRVTGDLTFWNEIALLAVFGPVGVLADRIGRREVFALGLLIMGIAYGLYPFASSLGELTAYRMIYAVGIAAATGMLGTLIADYPQSQSRGKIVALGGTLNGLGVVSVTVGLGGMMKAFVSGGADAETAGEYAHLIVAALCIFSAIIIQIGVRPGTPVAREERPPVGELIRSAFLEARNPRIALAYACAFVARADLVILGTFSILWGAKVAQESGLDAASGVAAGRLTFGMASVAALLWLPLMGFVLDRINRVTGTAICMTLTSLGFLSTLLMDNPIAPESRVLWALVGIGNISAFAAATTLVSAEAPTAKRGVVVGMFNMMGVIGILISSGIGGRLFDSVSPAAPFVLIGGLSALVVVFALVVRVIAPGPMNTGGGFMGGH
ncbi:MAG: MFS transporter [Gammaproteobacteria bacterium]